MAASPVASARARLPSRYQGRTESRVKRSEYCPALPRRRPASTALDGAAAEGRVDLVLAVAEPDVGGGGEASQERERAAVLAQHGGAERHQPASMADARQVVQQAGPEASVLPLVVHDHGDLGVV